MLKFWMTEDRRFDVLTNIFSSIFQPSNETRNELIPMSNFSCKRFDVSLLPVLALVVDIADNAEFIGVVEQLHNGQMAADEMLD
jgi:hypothetical protein